MRNRYFISFGAILVFTNICLAQTPNISSSLGADAGGAVTTLSISSQMTVGGDKTSNVTAQFGDINIGDPALKDGVVLKGVVQYRPVPAATDGRVRGSVVWNAVSLADGTATQPLATPLSSSFQTTQSTIPAGQNINAQGNVEAALATAKSLLTRAKVGGAGGGGL